MLLGLEYSKQANMKLLIYEIKCKLQQNYTHRLFHQILKINRFQKHFCSIYLFKVNHVILVLTMFVQI